MRGYFHILLLFGFSSLFSQVEENDTISIDSTYTGCLNCGMTNGFIRLSHSYFFTNKNDLALVQLPRFKAANSLGSEQVYVSLSAFDLYFNNKMQFNDVMCGIGFEVYPFKQILSFGIDNSLSYGMVGFNNFTGIERAEIGLDIPVYYSKNKGISFNLHTSASYYYRYSYKLFNYTKAKDTYYKNYGGYAFDFGVSMNTWRNQNVKNSNIY
jgi:hypothetical protein